MTDSTISPTPADKIVWLDMDQQALDDAYSQEKYAPNRAQVIARRVAAGKSTRECLGEPEQHAYGPTNIEVLDLFRTSRPKAPVNIFIHGGAWRENRASNYSALAEIFVNAGAHSVILDFINIEETKGDLFPIVEQVRRAIAWVYNNAASFGGDPERLYISGHSSGAHLGGCMITTDWKSLGLPVDLIKGALLLSGIYDLRPVRLSSRSNYVKFTDEIEHEFSPQRHIDRLMTPLVLAYGTYETPEFQRQTRDFFCGVQKVGKAVDLLVADDFNHFEVLETLTSPYGLTGRAVLRQMNLSAL